MFAVDGIYSHAFQHNYDLQIILISFNDEKIPGFPKARLKKKIKIWNTWSDKKQECWSCVKV